MKTTFHRPATLRQVPLQVLHELPLEVVSARGILIGTHHREGRHLVEQSWISVLKVERVDLYVLDQRVVALVPVRMHRQQAGCDIEHALELASRKIQSSVCDASLA